MTRVSTRFAAPILGLLLLASLPVWLYRSSPPIIEDCVEPAALLDLQRMNARIALTAHPEGGQNGPVKRVDGVLPVEHQRQVPIQLTLVRSHGLPGRFLRPASTSIARLEPDRSRVEWVEIDSTRIPIHLDYQTIQSGHRLAAYFYLYGGKPVTGPFRARLRGAFREILDGSLPITLVVASAESSLLELSETEERALGSLTEVWEYHRSVCDP